MINLMPPAQKEALAYARRNARLVKVMSVIFVALLGALVITVGSLFYLRQSTSSVQKSINESKSGLAAQNETQVLQQAKDMSDNLKLALDVLSNEILFSQLLNKIGEIMPSGTVLEGLSLSNEVFGIGIDLEVGARNYESGSRAYVNLNDKNNALFEKADLIDINCNDESRDGPYPCLVNIRALFAKDNPFKLVGETKQ